MKLETIRISNFQCFGEEPTELSLEDITYLIGPNGSGKTAALQVLCRLFAFDPSLRRIKRSDFHIPLNEGSEPTELQRLDVKRFPCSINTCQSGEASI